MLTTTGVPRGNGQVERVNGVIVPALVAHVGRRSREVVPTQSRSTKRTPFELMFGVLMRNREDQTLAAELDEALREDFGNALEHQRRPGRHGGRTDLRDYPETSRGVLESVQGCRKPTPDYIDHLRETMRLLKPVPAGTRAKDTLVVQPVLNKCTGRSPKT